MYRPPTFREDRKEVLHAAIHRHPLATLITCGQSGLVANVIPFNLRDTGKNGVLCAHLAKANEQIADLKEGSPALVVFQGPQGYITPSWYPTKHEHGKVVPTWNYVIVQVRGTPRIIDDTMWLRGQLGELTANQERRRNHPWEIADAPADFIAGQLKGIVGLEVPIERIEGKWKASQNRSAADRKGVKDGLREDGYDELANLIVER